MLPAQENRIKISGLFQCSTKGSNGFSFLDQEAVFKEDADVIRHPARTPPLSPPLDDVSRPLEILKMVPGDSWIGPGSINKNVKKMEFVSPQVALEPLTDHQHISRNRQTSVQPWTPSPLEKSEKPSVPLADFL